MELHELALILGRRVPEIKNWSASEVGDWMEYFRRRPYGWREDHRASYTLAAAGVEAKPHELFASLKAIEVDKEEEQNSSVKGDAAKLVGSGFFGKLLGTNPSWDPKVEV